MNHYLHDLSTPAVETSPDRDAGQTGQTPTESGAAAVAPARPKTEVTACCGVEPYDDGEYCPECLKREPDLVPGRNGATFEPMYSMAVAVGPLAGGVILAFIVGAFLMSLGLLNGRDLPW